MMKYCFDETSHSKRQNLQHRESIMPKFFVQGMIRLKSSVGDTTPQFTISIGQGNMDW